MPSKAQENPGERFNWRKELIEKPRLPRADWENVKKQLLRARDASVFLREEKRHTDIVLRFPASLKQLPADSQKVYSHLGMDMKAIFAELLWKKPPKSATTQWSTFVRTGYRAFRETWIYAHELLYKNHFHPDLDGVLQHELTNLENETKLSAGRRNSKAEERESISRRYKILVEQCEEIHAIVRRCSDRSFDKAKIKKAVFDKIYGSRIADPVLREEGAFSEIPYEKLGRVVSLHDATSWKPSQLAKALLALERECKYQTIEKATAQSRSRKNLEKSTL